MGDLGLPERCSWWEGAVDDGAPQRVGHLDATAGARHPSDPLS
jgi:hypothetical protein